MNPKNKRTLFLTSTICIILSIVAFALSHMGGASNENYILLYVIAVLLNIVLNLALSIKIASTNGAKALVSLGKWIMPIAGVVYLIPQVYSVLFPAKTMQDTYWYVFIGILFIVSGNYFPKNHINPYIGLKFPWLFNDEEGWYNTGDHVEVDGDYFLIQGRACERINVGGEKVYPAEVESVLLSIEGVADAAVVGTPNLILGQVVEAHICSDGKLDKEALTKRIKEVCRKKLEKYKRPMKIVFTDSTFESERFKKKRS